MQANEPSTTSSSETLAGSLRSRFDVLGVGIDSVNMREAVHAADDLIDRGRQGYICVTGVHGVMEAREDAALRQILNASFMTVPDGMPLVWIGRWLGHRSIDRVYGPDFMSEFCSLSVSRGYRHFLYGGKPGVAEHLAEVLTRRYPGLQIAGTCTPPFGPLSPEQETELIERVARSRPHVLWVGLSTPKQERFMARYLSRLDVNLMAGVGAAFDIHTGGIRDAPQWMKRAGLQWMHRLLQEPRRLGRRYLINNPRFLWLISLQLLRGRNR